MENLTFGIIGAVVAGFLVYLLTKNKKDNSGSTDELLIELIKNVDAKLGESQKQMSESIRYQTSESQNLIHKITEQINKSLIDVVREQTKTNEATTKFVSIAEQLGNLEKVLKHQKQRGNLGEASLELILSNILPPDAFTMQYMFKNGEKVDAVIKTKEGLISIDAKFSLDNYERLINAISDEQRLELENDFRKDLKKRIDETSKYVRETEGTLRFAFMFIPAEAIYYDLLVNEIGAVKVNTRNLIDYAKEKNVIIVSPTTFAAYLQSVLYGFKAFKFEETVKDVMKRVEELGKHYKAYEEFHNKLGNSINTVYNHYNASGKELKKIDKDVLKITGTSNEIEPLILDKMDTEE